MRCQLPLSRLRLFLAQHTLAPFLLPSLSPKVFPKVFPKSLPLASIPQQNDHLTVYSSPVLFMRAVTINAGSAGLLSTTFGFCFFERHQQSWSRRASR